MEAEVSSHDPRPVLVLGASGTQGGAVALALRARDIPVRGLARSEATAAKLSAAGITPVAGDFNDLDALVAACAGARAVFSMQSAPFVDPQSERREARTIVEAVRRAGTPQIVHTSVSGAGAYHRAMKDWGTGRWNENYWESKADAEDTVRASGLPFWTILKPAFLMENFIPPKVERFFPHLAQGELLTALKPETALVLVAADDVAAAAVAAIEAPQRFHQQEIELSGDRVTMAQAAEIFTRVTGRQVTARSVTPQAAVAQGVPEGWVASQVWSNEVPYPATPQDSRRYGLHPTPLAEWAARHLR